MKNSLLKVFMILTIMNMFQSFAQDTLFFKNQERSLVKIKDLTAEEISYLKFDYQDGPIYKINKSEVLKIHYQSGLRDTFEIQKPNESHDFVKTATKEIDPKSLTFEDGQRDAKKFYKGYKGAGTSSYLAGLFIVYGLPIPIITSISRPANARLYAPNQEAYKVNPNYMYGFNRKSHNIKAGKAWANYGYGAATSVGIGLALVIIALATYF